MARKRRWRAVRLSERLGVNFVLQRLGFARGHGRLTVLGSIEWAGETEALKAILGFDLGHGPVCMELLE
jgi:hypothetical protein